MPLRSGFLPGQSALTTLLSYTISSTRSTEVTNRNVSGERETRSSPNPWETHLFSESGDTSGVVGVEEPGLKNVSTPCEMSWSSSKTSARPMGLVGARVFTLRGRPFPRCWSCPQLLGSSETLSRDSAAESGVREWGEPLTFDRQSVLLHLMPPTRRISKRQQQKVCFNRMSFLTDDLHPLSPLHQISSDTFYWRIKWMNLKGSLTTLS